MSPWTGLLLFVLLSAESTAIPQACARTVMASVELKCKLVSDRGEARRSFWVIELRNSAGEPLHRTLRMVGETVRFKNLLPGIYRIYLWGRGGRRSVVSVDLTPAPGKASAEFAKIVRVPQAASPLPAGFQVDLRTLEIPKAALREMIASEKAARSGNHEETEQRLLRATEIDPEYADAWNNLGAYYHRRGDYARALQDFTRATELKPESHLGWMNLAASLLATGRFTEAVAAGEKALHLDPDDAIANSQLGLAYYYLHNYTDAKRCFKRALDLDPAMIQAPQLLLAQIAMRESDFDEAVAYLRGYLRYHPNSPNAGYVTRTIAVLAGNGIFSGNRVVK